MSDTTTATTEQATTGTAQATPADVAETLGEGGKNAIKAEREARKAAEDSAKSLQAQLDAIQAAQMSDLEKAQATASDFEKRAAQSAAEALKWRTAAKHGISDDDADTFLTGSDEATLTKQAERLAAMSATGPTTPKPDRTQGGSGEPPALNSNALEDDLRRAVGAI